jgi:DNA-binding CsgD family transcriptional regulator
LTVHDETVSRRHAEIVVADSMTVMVQDLDSCNGTFVEGERISKKRPCAGQHVMFGNVLYTVLSIERADPSESEVETAPGALPEAPQELARTILTVAQRRILKNLLRGLAEKKVASHLHLSPNTVHNHVQAIYRAFKVHSRPELLALFLHAADESEMS